MATADYVLKVNLVDGSQHTKYPDGDKQSEAPQLPAPTNTATNSITTSSFNLTWIYSSSEQDGFRVEYRLAGGSWLSDGDEFGASARERTITGLNSATDYEARVRGYVDFQGSRIYSDWLPVATARTQGIIVTPPSGGTVAAL